MKSLAILDGQALVKLSEIMEKKTVSQVNVKVCAWIIFQLVFYSFKSLRDRLMKIQLSGSPQLQSQSVLDSPSSSLSAGNSTASPSQAINAKASPQQATNAKASPSQATNAKASPSQARNVKASPSQARNAKVLPSKLRSFKTSPSESGSMSSSTSQAKVEQKLCKLCHRPSFLKCMDCETIYCSVKCQIEVNYCH